VIVNAIGLKRISVPAIFAEMLAAPAAVGVNVEVQVPSVHVTAPRVPFVGVSTKAAGVAVSTTFPNWSLTTTVTVAVPLTAIVVALTARVDLLAAGTLAITATLRWITIRPADAVGLRKPMSV
jgi:hypothetical protein